MILLDTNVISEPWKPMPDTNVVAWLDNQVAETLYLTAITVAEVRLGIAVLPHGKKRSILEERFEGEVMSIFAGRILDFDLDASRAYADLIASARMAGKAIGAADGYIAASAKTHGFAVATRDTRPFEAAGLIVINPWNLKPKE